MPRARASSSARLMRSSCSQGMSLPVGVPGSAGGESLPREEDSFLSPRAPLRSLLG